MIVMMTDHGDEDDEEGDDDSYCSNDCGEGFDEDRF